MPARLPRPRSSRPGTLEQVVSGGLCAGCGICASLAGSERITMELSPRGDARPRFHRPLAPAEQRRLVAVCPGATAVAPASAQDPGMVRDPIWGPVRALRRGWAADPAVRHHAAAGGALTALSIFLLESDRVDAVLHVRASTSRPMLTDAHISRTRAEVLSGAQSRYGPASPLVHVRELLDAGERFAVVGKPCDIAAVHNLRAQDPRVASQVPYLLTLFCGGAPNVGTAEQIAAAHGVSPDEVGVFRFRGEGWPGTTHIESTGGAVFDLSYDQSWLDKTQPWRYDVQWRCKICPDAIGETADLSCPDGWRLDERGQPVHEEAPGTNAIVERTRRGSELIAAAVSAGYLVTEPLERREFEQMHHDHRTRRLGEPARLAALLAMGRPRPRVAGYRLGHAAAQAGPRLLFDQFRGAVRRIRKGQAAEPLLTGPDQPADSPSQ